MTQVIKKKAGPAKAASGLAQALKNELVGSDWPREGSVMEVEFIKKEARQAFFDLGRFGTGIVYGLEFSNGREIINKMKPGEKIHAKVLAIDGEDGYVELSLTEADKQRVWQEVKELQESGEVVKAKVTGANTGGLTVQLGTLDARAFLPVSQLSSDHYPKVTDGDPQKIAEELKKFIDQELNVKIIDSNPRTNKLIVSEREMVNANMKELLTNYEVGQVIDGIVSGVADFGVFIKFIDKPEIEGLIHISELDYRIIDNPKELVSMSETLKAKIIEIRDGRVFLSLKALKPDPWEKVEEMYSVGQEVSGKIYKLNPFGALVNLHTGIQGAVHIADFGGVDEMKKALTLGEAYEFTIDSIKPQEKRLTLKLKK